VSKTAKKKQSEGVRFNNNLALKIQCDVVKYALLQTAFSAILPTAIMQYTAYLGFKILCQLPKMV